MQTRQRSSRSPWLLLPAMVALLAATVFAMGRGASPAEAAIQGSIKGYAQALQGSVTLNNGTGTQIIPNPLAVSLPTGGSDSGSIAWTDSGSLTVRISGNAEVSCTGMSSAPIVIDANCTTTITNFAVSFQSVTPIQISRIVVKAGAVGTASMSTASSSGTVVEGVCVREAQGNACMPIAQGGSVNFVYPPVSGSVSLQTETVRSQDGNTFGKGVRVTGVRISLNLLPTQVAPTGGTLSLTLGIADAFVGGIATPTVPATNTPSATNTPPPFTPTPTVPADPHPFKAFVPVLSRDD